MTKSENAERKKAEKHLAEKEAQLRIALDNLPGAMAYMDADMKLVVCNDRYRTMYDFPEELVRPGAYVPDIFRYKAENGQYGPGDVDAMVAERVESVRDPANKVFEDRTSDGHIHEVRRRRVEGGGTVTVITDVTGERQAEEALRESEEVHRNLIEGSVQGIFIHDNWKPLFVNDALARMFGYDSPEEVIALGSAERLYAPEELERLKDYRDARLRGEGPPETYEFKGLKKDGSEIWLQRSSRVIAWHGQLAIQGTVIDITERKKLEEKLQITLDEFGAVLENIDYGISFFDSDLKFQLINRAFKDMWGIPEDFEANRPTFGDLIYFNRYNNIYDVPDEEFDEYVEQRSARVREGSIPPQEMKRADGKIFRYQCVSLPDGGRLLTYFDITDREQAMAQLEKEKKRSDQFNKMATGRELRMIEMKKEVDELLERLGEEPRYK